MQFVFSFFYLINYQIKSTECTYSAARGSYNILQSWGFRRKPAPELLKKRKSPVLLVSDFSSVCLWSTHAHTASCALSPMLALASAMWACFSAPPHPFTVFFFLLFTYYIFACLYKCMYIQGFSGRLLMNVYTVKFPLLCGEVCHNLSILHVIQTPTLHVSISVFVSRLKNTLPKYTVLYMWETVAERWYIYYFLWHDVHFGSWKPN